jgi:hypothetical protein
MQLHHLFYAANKTLVQEDSIDTETLSGPKSPYFVLVLHGKKKLDIIFCLLQTTEK